MISILGSIKIPNIIPGIEFQLSAPLAVAICSVFGFKKYIISGILSSVICLALGTQNILNVAIAMQFRLIVGLLLYLAQNHLYMIIFAGPIASLIARFSLFFLSRQSWCFDIFHDFIYYSWTYLHCYSFPYFSKYLKENNS